MMADGGKPKKSFRCNIEDKEKKEGQHEEQIIHVCMYEFDLNQEEALTSLKKAGDDRMLKIVNKNNKKSYRIVQEIHLDEDCVIDS